MDRFDYPSLAKYGALAGLLLAVAGFVAAEVATGGGAPGWTLTAATDAEILGTLGFLLCPLVFGVVLPLTRG